LCQMSATAFVTFCSILSWGSLPSFALARFYHVLGILASCAMFFLLRLEPGVAVLVVWRFWIFFCSSTPYLCRYFVLLLQVLLSSRRTCLFDSSLSQYFDLSLPTFSLSIPMESGRNHLIFCDHPGDFFFFFFLGLSIEQGPLLIMCTKSPASVRFPGSWTSRNQIFSLSELPAPYLFHLPHYASLNCLSLYGGPSVVTFFVLTEVVLYPPCFLPTAVWLSGSIGRGLVV